MYKVSEKEKNIPHDSKCLTCFKVIQGGPFHYKKALL